MASKKPSVERGVIIVCLFLLFHSECLSDMPISISSPNGRLQAIFKVDYQGRALYSIERVGKTVLQPSNLGLVLNGRSFADKLTLENASEPQILNGEYRMLLGKRKNCSYKANRRTFTLKNETGDKMQVIFQVSDDGVAFRYVLPEQSDKPYTVTQEKTTFAFSPATVSWLQPIQPGKTGWNRTQPSYEEYYSCAQPVGTPGPSTEGWALPALFKTSDDIWVFICDSDVDENYCAVRLAS